MKNITINKFIACIFTLSLLTPVFGELKVEKRDLQQLPQPQHDRINALHAKTQARQEDRLNEYYNRTQTPQAERLTVQELHEQQNAAFQGQLPVQQMSQFSGNAKMHSKINMMEPEQLKAMLIKLGDLYQAEGMLALVDENARNCYNALKAGGNPSLHDLRNAIKVLVSEPDDFLKRSCINDLVLEIIELLEEFSCGGCGTTIVITQADIGANGYHITVPGNYCLAEDVVFTNNISVAIFIQASNVNLDLNGHSIDLGNSQAWGVQVFSAVESIQNIVIHNGTIKNGGFSSAGIVIFDSQNIVIDSISSIEIPRPTGGIAMQNAANIVISNCAFYNSINFGPCLTCISTSGLIVENCICKSNGPPLASGAFLYLESCTDCIIKDCEKVDASTIALDSQRIAIRNCSSRRVGFAVNDLFDGCSMVTIDNCRSELQLLTLSASSDISMHNVTYYAGLISADDIANILIDSYQSFVTPFDLINVRGGTIRNSNTHNITANIPFNFQDSSNILVENLEIVSLAQGINLINSNRVTLANCLCRSAYQGTPCNILIEHSNDVWMQNCEFYNTDTTIFIEGVTLGGNILVFGSNAVQIDNCVTNSSVFAGLTIAGALGSPSTHCTVLDCVVSQGGAQGGIFLDTCTACAVFNCQSSFNTGDGISVGANAFKGWVEGNAVFENGGYGIKNNGNASNLFYSNFAYSNGLGNYLAVPLTSPQTTTVGVLANIDN